MLYTNLASFLLLPAVIRFAAAKAACNNSPDLCDLTYDKVTYLGAHDSPFVRDASNGFSASGNQFYTTSEQLSAGVRLVTAQIQDSGSGELKCCHTSCDLFDAGPLSTWLEEVRTWMDANPNEVVTVLLVNGPDVSPAKIEAEYTKAGITSDLAYTPSGSSAGTQTWPTLQSLIDSGTRLVNFVDSFGAGASVPWLMPEFDYIFENPYTVTALSGFTCPPQRPTSVSGDTQSAITDGLLPFMNHFLSIDAGLDVMIPAVDNSTTTNAYSGGVGTLGSSATQCSQEYGRNPTYLLVDFFNVGPAIKTADKLNGVTNAVGRTHVSKAIITSAAGSVPTATWSSLMLICSVATYITIYL